MQSIAIANHKGGTGKTATAHNLGHALAGRGLRVLMIDLDPQGSLTLACGVQDAGKLTMAGVMGGSAPGGLGLGEVVRELGPRLALAPADIELAGAELGLISRLGRENVLRKAMQGLAMQFDIALIDCPPSLGLLTVNALTAADRVLIPTAPTPADLRGTRLFLASVAQVREALNPGLQALGVLVTFWDPRLALHRDALQAMQAAGLPVLSVMIGRSVRVAEAAGAGQALAVYEPRNPQAAAYSALAEELMTCLSLD